MKKSRKFLALLLVVVFTMFAFAACGGEEAKEDDKKEDAKEDVKEDDQKEDDQKEDAKEDIADPAAGPAIDKDTVVIATADETPSLTTAGHNAVAGDYVNRLTHNGLFYIDRELNPQPDLVKEFTVEKDENGEETIWKMTLHEGIKFHDGSDLTTDDVIASINAAKESPNVSTYTKTVAKIEKVDDLSFVIHTDGPSASLLYDLAHHGNYILPSELIESGNDFNENPIGAGPYKFVSWTEGTELKFEAFEDYFNKDRAPAIKNIVWKIIPEGSSRTIALEAGEVDYIIELDSTSIDTVKSNPNLALIEIPSISHSWLTVNNEVAPFDDINLRKAINAAINKEDVVTVALNGAGVVAQAQTPMGMLGENPEGFDSYDLDKAKEYLKAWGGDASTIELPVICSNDTKRRAAEVIQANLAELGIKVEIVSMDLSTYLSETAAGNFTGFIGGYTANNMMTFLQGVYHSSNINASNKTRTANPELDALIEKSVKTVDKEERRAVLEEATKLLNDNCYQMPLWQDSNLSGRKANLKNTFLTTSGGFYVQEWTW